MGILDDAIREHLDLKRKHGAQEDEVQILEDEAFGPPSRPGDPDFPERPPTGEQAIEQAPETGEEMPETGEEPLAETPEAEVEAPPPADLESPFFDQARGEDPGEPTVEHPAPEAPEAEFEAPVDEPPALEPEEPVPASPESDEFEIGELELEIDEEFEEFREDDSPEAAAPEAAAPAETEVPAEDVELDEDAQEEADPEGEDVLEETPEFLRDTPEDERLWFEQGAPKDFDFEDEDEEEEDEGR